MNIKKLWHYITKLEAKYYYIIDQASSVFLQEVMDPDGFYDNDMKHIPSCYQVLQTLENTLNKSLSMIAQNCAIEFCITNEYIVEGQTWNCINHLFKYHTELLTVSDKKYLQALNNSYLGIYRVISVVFGKSIVLQDMIEHSDNHFTILDNEISKTIATGSIIAARLIAIEHKTKPMQYQLSNSLILLPKRIALNSTAVIKALTEAMNNANGLFAFNQERIEDNAHNRLLKKKMWAKEILEQWYSYYVNYMDYHEIFDYEGNPWDPCQIVFDIITGQKEIAKIFNNLPYFIPNEVKKSCNSWIWIDDTGSTHLDFSDMKYKKPDLNDSNKTPIYCGTIIANQDTSLVYRILAEVEIKNNKLIIDVYSAQRGRIVQDFITTQLKIMVGNFTIIKKEIDVLKKLA